MAITNTFIEAGGTATKGLDNWAGTIVSGGGSTAYSTQAVFGSIGSIAATYASSGYASVYQFGLAGQYVADAGTRITFAVRFSATPLAVDIFVPFAGGPTVQFYISVNAGGVLAILDNTHASVATGTTVLAANTDYLITVAYTITSTSVNQVNVYLGTGTASPALEVTTSNFSNTSATSEGYCLGSYTTSISWVGTAYYAHFLNQIGASTGTPGNIRVTAKRPFTNGTTNGFTTQIGSGGSGYGTGHTPQVNERPLSTADGWSILVAGSPVTEEYTVEGQAVGDVSTANATIIGVMGWILAKSSLSETDNILVDGTTTNIAATSTATMFSAISPNPTTYPAGTGSDIGMVTNSTAATASLYEAGIIVAFIPSTATPVVGYDQFNPKGPQYPSHLRTYLTATPNQLTSQDKQFRGAGQWQTYDYPNPTGPRRVVDLLTWVQNLNQTTLLIPFKQTDFPNPSLGPRRPIENITFLNAVELQLIGKDQFFAAPGQAPTYDYPNPKAPQRNQNLLSWASFFSPTLFIEPFYQSDFPNPIGPKRAVDLLSWLQDLNQLLTVPFSLTDWPVPPGARRVIDFLSWSASYFNGFNVKPFLQADHPNPRGAIYPSDLRSFAHRVDISLIGKDKFFGEVGQLQKDFPNPQLPRPLSSLHMGSFGLNTNLPPPIVGTIPIDRPTELGLDGVAGESTGSFDTDIGE